MLIPSAWATATVVDVIETSAWARPSTDPSGIAYLRRSDRFLVVDGEVDETAHWEGANGWVMTRDGDVLRSFRTNRFSLEPTDVAVFRRAFFFSDDLGDVIFRVRRGPDRRIGTRDDRVRSLSTHAYGSTDPEGIAYARGFLFIADGFESGDPAIYRIDPGRNGRFNATAGSDDVVRRIDAGGLGLRDPEGVTYARGSLYIVSRLGRNRGIVQTTLRGRIVNTYDLSGTGINKPAGIAVVRADDGSLHAYVTDRGVDNAADPDENDGEIFVFALS